MMTPEGRVKKDVKKVLDANSIYYFMPTQSGYGVVGILDFLCCDHGHFLAIETKAPGKRNNTTPNQKMQIFLTKEAGGDAIVVDDVQQLQDYLDGNYKESKGEAKINEGDWS
jgi:hypothetical protein